MLRAKYGLSGAVDPVGQRLAAVARLGGGFAVQRRRPHRPAGARMADLAAGAHHHHRLPSEDAEFLTGLVADPSEEGRETVVILLAKRFVRMMVALGALETDAEEELRRRLGEVLRVVGDAVVIGRAVAERRAARGDQLADKTVERLVVAERGRQPVVQRPHALFADRGAVGANQVGPFQGPEGGVSVVVYVAGRIARQPQQSVDELVALVGMLAVEEGRRLFRRR